MSKLDTVVAFIESKGWIFAVSSDRSHIAVSNGSLIYCHTIDHAYNLYTGVPKDQL